MLPWSQSYPRRPLFIPIHLGKVGKPSPWLDTILVKIGKQMSDWEFYSWEDDDVLADVNAWDTQATTLIQ